MRVGIPLNLSVESAMIWTKPSYQDFRFGFEITLYISAR
jgi:coenzyme PQQ precursor peptide PqqA